MSDRGPCLWNGCLVGIVNADAAGCDKSLVLSLPLFLVGRMPSVLWVKAAVWILLEVLSSDAQGDAWASCG